MRVSAWAEGHSLIHLSIQERAVVTNLEGKWKYQSYCPVPVSLSALSRTPGFVAWSPPGDVTIDAGSTTGTLVFKDLNNLTLALKLSVAEATPVRVSISADLPSHPGAFTNELVGWFVPAGLSKPAGTDNPGVIRGSIVQTSPSPPAQPSAPPSPPALTTGFFVLEPA